MKACRPLPFLLLCLSTLVAPVPVHGQLLITEFMAVNDNNLVDEDVKFSDWIEIYNPGAASVNLSDWFLTDDAANLTKWRFPNTNLAAYAYLVVFASNNDRRVPGATLHTNFKLSGGGSFLALVNSNAVDGVIVVSSYSPTYPNQTANISYGLTTVANSTNILLATGAGARAFVPTGSIGAGWTAAGYDDSSWLAATTGVGFDTGTNYDSAIATDIQAQMLGVNSSVYLRVPFTVANPSLYEELKLRMRYDDGFVAYLNGQEIARRNAPATPLWNSAATARHGSDTGVGGIVQADFDTVTNAFTASQQSAAPGPAILAANAGSTGRFIRLINDGVNSQFNSIAFNQTATGVFQVVSADFDFRATSVDDPADGFAFMLIPVSVYGASGVGVNPIGAVEEPNYAGVFSIGFDVYPRGTQNDVSAHWNGSEYQNVTMPNASINLTSGTFHHANVVVAYEPGGARVTVTLTPNINAVPGTAFKPINELFIPGLTNFNSRVQLAARTGGLDMSVDFDNVVVRYGFPSGLVSFDEFLVSGALGALQPGNNVLAIQGLNFGTNDADVLFVPELVARDITVQTNLSFFSAPTPGTANEGGAPGVSGTPVFSLPGGVYTNASVTVSLSNPSGDGVIRYTIDGTVPGATSPLYSAPLVIANSTVVKASVFAPGLLSGRIVVNTYTMLGADLLAFSSKLPLVVIDTYGQAISAENKIPASMVFIDTYRGRSSLLGKPDAQVRAGIELRGSSSLGFPKNSMGFETRDENTNDFAVSLLGMPAESDWVLYAPYTDKTFMNDFLAYELWDAMGHYGVRHKFVEVFRDSSGGRLTYSDYVGIYIFLEKIKIDKDRVNIPSLNGGDNAEPDISGGYIFKRDRFDGNEYTFNVNGGTGFAATTLGVEDPKGAQISTAQKNWLTGWFNQMAAALSGASFTNATTGYPAYIDVDSFIDHYWMVEMPKQIDGYRLSNFYHKDRNGKLKEGPIWDWNLAFGNANYLEGGLTNGYYAPQIGATADYPFYPRLFADPDFTQKHADRWLALRTNVFATSNILARVDAITNLLNEAQARDFARWPRLGTYIWPNPDGANLVPTATDGTTATWNVNFATIATYSGVIGEMKRWIEGRLAVLDTGFTKPPTLSPPAGPFQSEIVVLLAAPAGTIYYTLDGTDPRGPGGQVAAGARTASGPITITNNARVFARTRIGATLNNWSGPVAGTYVAETPRLVISEIMYHPAPPLAGSTNSADDFEYIELRNAGSIQLNLRNARVSGGIDFTFASNLLLAPGGHTLLVRNLDAFQSRYGLGLPVAGVFTGNLANDGDHLVLEGPVGEAILDFNYDDDWYPTTDGLGFSLVVVNDAAPLSAWGSASNWQPSGTLGGSPGVAGSAPVLPAILITEALTHTDVPPPTDSIEIYNPGAAANIGGWFLSDDLDVPKKYRIADGTMIGAGSRLVFNESQFNATNGLGVLEPFALEADGDQVYLFSGDAGTNLTGYVHGFAFGGQRNGVTFGRHVTSIGEEHFVAQIIPTLGAANSGPLVGPAVISEIMYRPAEVFTNGAYWNNNEEEYVELQNLTASPLPLYDPAHASNTWHLGGVDFQFPPGVSIPANGYLIVVNFDPIAYPAQASAFRAKYGVPPGVQVFGPYEGNLGNAGEGVSLYMPDTPVPQPPPFKTIVPSVLVDRVRYSDHFPWPDGGDGFGLALQRKAPSQYGDDPANWDAAGPTPGSGYVSGVPPVITAQPVNQSLAAGNAANFSVTASGPGPLRYQWRRDGQNIPNGTNAVLTLFPVQFSDAGNYQALVLNPYGFASSSNALLTVLTPPSIGVQPTNVSLRVPPDPAALPSRVAIFRVSAATANPPLSYQWRVNGTNVPANDPNITGVTSNTLTITNVVLENGGDYFCLVSDAVGTVPSATATLVALVAPVIVQAPVAQTVAAGSPLNVSVAITGSPAPFGYQWRSGSVVYPLIISNARTNFMTLQTATNAGTATFRVVVTNAASTGNGVFAQFTVVTVADTDRDGIADSVETALGLNPNNPADAAGDLDGDGMKNLAEILAGTDPNDPNSYLRVGLTAIPGLATVQFAAVSNRTYTVQYTDALRDTGAAWTKLADVLARNSNRVETFLDPTWTTNRFYRIVLPARP